MPTHGSLNTDRRQQTIATKLQCGEEKRDLDNGHVRSGAGRLVLALSSDPRSQAFESALQGADFAHAAALLMAVLVERKEALGPHQRLHLGRIRKHVLNVQIVALLNVIKQLQGFLVQPSGLQTEDSERQPRKMGVLDESNILCSTDISPKISAPKDPIKLNFRPGITTSSVLICPQQNSKQSMTFAAVLH